MFHKSIKLVAISAAVAMTMSLGTTASFAQQATQNQVAVNDQQAADLQEATEAAEMVMNALVRNCTNCPMDIKVTVTHRYTGAVTMENPTVKAERVDASNGNFSANVTMPSRPAAPRTATAK